MIDETLEVIAGLAERQPIATRPEQLGALVARLAAADAGTEAPFIEDATGCGSSRCGAKPGTGGRPGTSCARRTRPAHLHRMHPPTRH